MNILMMGLSLMLLLSGSTIPTVQQVAEKAFHYARLNPENVRDWSKKARKAPYLPRLQFTFDRHLKNNINLNVADQVSVGSTGVTVGPPEQTQIQNADNDMNFEVKVVWFLDQLLYSKDDLEISAEARELAQERERILNQIRQNYFKRERLAQEVTLLKKSHAPNLEQNLKQIEMADATAVLDGLTGGWFSEQLQGGL